MWRFSGLTIALAALAFSTPSRAITLNSGDTLLVEFNFDLTATSSPQLVIAFDAGPASGSIIGNIYAADAAGDLVDAASFDHPTGYSGTTFSGAEGVPSGTVSAYAVITVTGDAWDAMAYALYTCSTCGGEKIAATLTVDPDALPTPYTLIASTYAPLPGTAPLFASGLAALVLLRRRRRHRLTSQTPAPATAIVDGAA
jgi:MYXO-CTERM domain-containing protein